MCSINILDILEVIAKTRFPIETFHKPQNSQPWYSLLKGWEESFSLGKDPAKDPDTQLSDLASLKRLSKIEFTVCSKILFRSIRLDANAERVESFEPHQIRKRSSVTGLTTCNF